MYDQSKPKTEMVGHLISRLVLTGIALALAVLLIVVAGHNATAASPSANHQDGALRDANATDPGTYEESPRYNLRDATMIQFEEDNWLLVEPEAGSSTDLQFADEAWIRFIEENVLPSSAAGRSDPVQTDNADRIASLGVDMLDESLGIDHYRDHACTEDEAESDDVPVLSLDW